MVANLLVRGNLAIVASALDAVVQAVNERRFVAKAACIGLDTAATVVCGIRTLGRHL